MGEYCAAVELLLARMDSNPEEFSEGGRWERLVARNRAFLPMEDQMALTDKINTLRLEAFHKEVMSELLAEPSENVAVDPGYYQTTIPTSNFPAGQQLSPSALTAGNTTANLNLSRQSIKEIAAQLQSYASNTWKK